MMKVTMKDIANKLGISINAVSIALNDKPGVSDEMRLEILRTADQLGYVNKKKKYLSVFSKSNICVMMQGYYANTGHFYSIVLRSIVEKARQFGYFAILNYFDDDSLVVPDCIVDRKVAGILIVGKISDANLMMIKKTGLPVVLVDFTSLCDAFDCVLTHNKQGGYMMTSHAIEKGYKKIGFFGDLDYSLSFHDRFMGYKHALIKNGIVDSDNADKYIKKYSWTYHTERAILDNDIHEIVNILSQKELPEVLICANDSNAFALISALNLMGKKVPEDIGVTGFDDTPLCMKSVPQITTVEVQKELMGQTAVSHLVDRIHKIESIPMTCLLSVNIIERASLK